MKYKIRGEKLVVTDAIKDYIEGKFEKLDKYFTDSQDITASILIRAKGKDQTIEATIPTKNFLLRCEETNKDLYTAIDQISDKLERQIRKNKTKLEKKFKKAEYRDFNIDFEPLKEEETTNIVKRKKLEAKPISEEEAILQMELVGHDFYIFKDMDDFSVKVLYRRKDGNYGIIETEETK